MVGSIKVCDYFLEFGAIDFIPVFLFVEPFFPERQKVIAVGKHALLRHVLNQLYS